MHRIQLAVILLITFTASSTFAFEDGTCFELKGETLEGKPVAADDGKWTVLEFWATWCEPCHTSVDETIEVVSKHPFVRLIGVNSESDLGDVREFARSRGWHFPTIFDRDQDLLGLANPRALPFTVLLDPAGCVRWQGVGGHSETLDELAKRLTKISAER